MKQKGAANFLAILGLAILVLVIPLTVKLVEQRQELRKSAETYPPQTVCGDNSCDSGESCSSCPGDCGSCPVIPTSPPALPGGSENWKCPGANCDKCGYAGWWGGGCDDFCSAHPNDGSCSQKNVPGPLTACGNVANQCAAGSGPVRDCSGDGKIVVRDCGNDGCYHNITTSEDCTPVVQLPTTPTTTEEQEVFKIIQTDAEKRCEALLGVYAIGSPVWTNCVSEQKESIVKELTEDETRFNQQLAIVESICQKQGADANERMWDNCFNRYVGIINNDFNLDPVTGQKYLRPEAVVASGCQGIAVFSNDPLNYYDCQNGSKEYVDTPTRNLCQTDTGLIDYNVCQSFLSEVDTRCKTEFDRGDLQGERCRDVQSAILKTEIETEQTRQETELAKRGEYCGDTGRSMGIAACLSDTAKQIIKGYSIQTDQEGKPTGTLYLEPSKAKKLVDCFSGSSVGQDDFNNWYSCFGGIKLTQEEAAQKLGVTSLPTVNINQQIADNIIKPGSTFYANFVQAVADKDKGATTFWVKDEQGQDVPVTIQIGFGEAGTDGYLIAMGGRFIAQGKLSDIQTDFEAATQKADEIKAAGFDPNILALLNQGTLQKTGLAQGSVVPSYKPYDPSNPEMVSKYGVSSDLHVSCEVSFGEMAYSQQADEACTPEKIYLEDNYAHISGAGVSVATNIDSAKRAYNDTSVIPSCGVLAEKWNEDCQDIFVAKVGGDLVSNQNAVKHVAVTIGTGILPLVPVVIAPAHAVPPVAFVLDAISFVGSTMAFSAKEEDQRYAAKVLLEDKFGKGITDVSDVGTYSAYDLAQKAKVDTSGLGNKDTIDNRYLAYTMYATGFNLSGMPGPTPKPVIEVTDPTQREAIINDLNRFLSGQEKIKNWDEMVQLSIFRDDILAYQKKALQSGSGVVFEEKEAEYRQALVNNAVMGAVTVGGMSLAGKGLGKAVDLFVTSRATQTIEREVAATRWAKFFIAGRSEDEALAKILGQDATARIILTNGKKVAAQAVKDNLGTYATKIAGVALKDDHQLAAQAVNEAAKGAGLLERFSPSSLAKKVDLDALGEGKVALVVKTELAKAPALPTQPATPAETAVPAVPEAPKVVAPPKYSWRDRLPIIGTNEPGKIEQAAVEKFKKETIPEDQLDDAITAFLEQNGYRQGSLADGANKVRDVVKQAQKQAIAQEEAEQARVAAQSATQQATREQWLNEASNLGVNREIAGKALDEAADVLKRGGTAQEAVAAARRKFLSSGGEIVQEDELAQIAQRAVQTELALGGKVAPAPAGVPQAVINAIDTLPQPLQRPARGLVVDLPNAVGRVSEPVANRLSNLSDRYLTWSENFNQGTGKRVAQRLSDTFDRTKTIFSRGTTVAPEPLPEEKAVTSFMAEKLGISENGIKPLPQYSSAPLGEAAQAKQLRLVKDLKAKLENEGVLASPQESLEHYKENFGVTDYSGPEEFLGLPGGGTFLDPRTQTIKVYLNPLLNQFNPDYQLYTVLEETIHWSQLTQAGRTVVNSVDEIAAKNIELRLAKSLGFDNERMQYLWQMRGVAEAVNMGIDGNTANKALLEGFNALKAGKSNAEALAAARRTFLDLGGQIVQEDEFAKIAQETIQGTVPTPGFLQGLRQTVSGVSDRYLAWSENFNKGAGGRIAKGLSDATDNARETISRVGGPKGLVIGGKEFDEALAKSGERGELGSVVPFVFDDQAGKITYFGNDAEILSKAKVKGFILVKRDAETGLNMVAEIQRELPDTRGLTVAWDGPKLPIAPSISALPELPVSAAAQPLSQRIVTGLNDATDNARNLISRLRGGEVKPTAPAGFREVQEGEVFAPGRTFRMDLSTGKNYVNIVPGEVTPPAPAGPNFLQRVTAPIKNLSDRYAQWADNFNVTTGPRIGQRVGNIRQTIAREWGAASTMERVAYVSVSSAAGMTGATILGTYCGVIDENNPACKFLAGLPPIRALGELFDRLGSALFGSPVGPTTPTGTPTRKPTETVTPPASKTATATPPKFDVGTPTPTKESLIGKTTLTAADMLAQTSKDNVAKQKQEMLGKSCSQIYQGGALDGMYMLKDRPDEMLFCGAKGKWEECVPNQHLEFDPTAQIITVCGDDGRWRQLKADEKSKYSDILEEFSKAETKRKEIIAKYGINLINRRGFLLEETHLAWIEEVLETLRVHAPQMLESIKGTVINIYVNPHRLTDWVKAGGNGGNTKWLGSGYDDIASLFLSWDEKNKTTVEAILIHELMHIYDRKVNLGTDNSKFKNAANLDGIYFDVQGKEGVYQLTEETVKKLDKIPDPKGLHFAYNCSKPFLAEYLACVTQIYFFNPEDVRLNFPNTYEYLKSVFGSIKIPITTAPVPAVSATQPGLSPGTGTPTQPPSVTITQDNVDRLKTFPRPPNDNGRGFHFTLDMKPETVASDIRLAQDMGVKWAVLYAGDEKQAVSAATQVWQAGIMPIIRFKIKTNQAGENFKNWVRITTEQLKAQNIPVYIQIYNEPGDDRDWQGSVPKNYADIFARNWRTIAEIVDKSGGYPGLQVLSQAELEAVLKVVPPGDPLWQKTWFSLHDYGNYGTTFNAPDYVPAKEDETAFLNFLVWAKIFEDKLGFVPPIIGTEGGWEPKSEMGPGIKAQVADYYKQVYDSFRTGVLPNGEPLPDYFFTFSPYILGGYTDFKGFAWYGGIHDMTDSVNAIKEIPNFERKFSWNVPTPTSTTTPTVTKPPTATPTRTQTPTITKTLSSLGGTGVFQTQETDLRPIENIQKVNLELCKQNSANCSQPFDIWFRMGQLTQADQATFLDDRLSRIMNYCDTQGRCVNNVPIIEIHDQNLGTTGLSGLTTQAVGNLSAALGKYAGKLPGDTKPIVILGGREISFIPGQPNYISVDAYSQIMLKVVNYCTKDGAWSCNFELALPAVKTDSGRGSIDQAKAMADKLLSNSKISSNVTMGSMILHRNSNDELIKDMEYATSIWPTIKRTAVIECCAIETEKQLQSQIESVTKQSNYVKAISDYAKANNISIPYVIINNTIVRKDTVPIINNAGNGQVLDFYKWGSPPSADKIKIPAGPQSYLEVPKNLWQQVLTAVSGSIISAISVINLLFGGR